MATSNWFGGTDPSAQREFFAQFAVDLHGAMDGHDIGMADARQEACIGGSATTGDRIHFRDAQDLERDDRLEFRVVGAIDVAECATADALQSPEGSPRGPARHVRGRVGAGRCHQMAE